MCDENAEGGTEEKYNGKPYCFICVISKLIVQVVQLIVQLIFKLISYLY